MSTHVLSLTAEDTTKASRDPVAWWLAAIASVLSIAAWWYFDRTGVILAYEDSVSHMEIARRVLDSPTPGLAQLGGVWLPLPHVLALPFVWHDGLYYSGVAGSLVSMASYVITSVLLYKIVLGLTAARPAAIAGAVFFMANPNVLYLQSTPMTEMLLLACAAGMVYCMQKWVQSDDYRWLLGAGVAAVLGSLTRYEAWILLVTFTGAAIFIAVRKGYSRARIEGTILAFLLVAGLGVAAWLVWNQVIFGNALNFQTGKYAQPSLWVSEADVAVGDWLRSLQAYTLAVLANLGIVGVALAATGLLLLLVRRDIGLVTLPALGVLVLFPFFVIAIESGQRPLHVPSINGDLYNIRFGLPMIIPAAVLVGYLVRWLARSRWTRALSAAGIAVAILLSATWAFADSETRISTLREPTLWLESGGSGHLGASNYLKRNYDGGTILAQFFGNEMLFFDARIPLRNNVYEGTYQRWERALADPLANGIDWIVMRSDHATDEVTARLSASDRLASFKSIYEDRDYVVYARR
jgi:4-amino-4-deoxy-L-arabinose transferase-like glycosyltransferase